jgi:hypothetical protein
MLRSSAYGCEIGGGISGGVAGGNEAADDE